MTEYDTKLMVGNGLDEKESDMEYSNDDEDLYGDVQGLPDGDDEGGCCSCFGGKDGRLKTLVKSFRADASHFDDDEMQMTKTVAKLKKRWKAFVKEHDEWVDDGAQSIDDDLIKGRIFKDDISVESYGILAWSLAIEDLQTQQRDISWVLLTYLAKWLPTPVVTSLFTHFRYELTRFDQKNVEVLTKSAVDGSEFPLATSLAVGAYFKERSQHDLSNQATYQELTKQYQLMAIDIINDIESDYLALMMMEISSFHEGMSPLDIALENRLVHFLASDRVARVSHAIWTRYNVLEPPDSSLENAFALSPITIVDVNDLLVKSRYEFYFTPIGFFVVQLFLFVLYLGVFTALTIRREEIYGQVTWVDGVFWFANIGYILNEFVDLSENGLVGYFSSWDNILDFFISSNFCALIVLRTMANSYAPWQANGKNNVIESRENIAYKVLWMINAILLWTRLLYFLMLSSEEGPLINVTKNMIKDVYSFMKVFAVVFLGFLYASYFLVGDRNTLFAKEQTAALHLFRPVVGQTEWDVVGATNFAGNETIGGFQIGAVRAGLILAVMCVFTIIGMILLVNLLIAMMANTYSMIQARSTQEVLLNKAERGYEIDNTPNIIPAPLNGLVFILYFVYNIVDILLLMVKGSFINDAGLSKKWKCEQCQFKNSGAVISQAPVGDKERKFACDLCGEEYTRAWIEQNQKRRLFRSPKSQDSGQRKSNYCQRLYRGIRELFDLDEDFSGEWLCGYCRVRIPPNQPPNIDRWIARLETEHRIDPEDVIVIKMLDPQVCPHCFRHRSERKRPTYILEMISFQVFTFLVYPVLRIILLPAYLIQLIEWINESAQKSEQDKLETEQKLGGASFSLDPTAIKRIMPAGRRHQELLTLRHPVWSAVRASRREGKAKGNHVDSAGRQQEQLETDTQQQYLAKISGLSEDVMQLVETLAHAQIKWDADTSRTLKKNVTLRSVDFDAGMD